MFERLQEELALDRAKRHSHMYIQSRGSIAGRAVVLGRLDAGAVGDVICYFLRQIGVRDPWPTGNDQRALNHVAQLPYIARPASSSEQLETLGFDTLNRFPH